MTSSSEPQPNVPATHPSSRASHARSETPSVQRLDVSVYRVPTATPEADGTIAWDATTMVLVELTAANGIRGLGWSYASEAAALVIRNVLTPIVVGQAPDDVKAVWTGMIAALRNLGRPGVGAMAISAVDIALWDLKARLANQALFHHLGAHRHEVPIYGSGGFTNYSNQQLAEQLAGWVQEGIPQVKMKLGSDWGTKPDLDIARVQIAREAIGPKVGLFVDANGGYETKQAVEMARRFADYDVSWFEEPVSADQLHEMRFVREHAPMRVAAGEYGFDPWYFRDMLRAEAVDVLQADATRCLGVTGWLVAADLAYSHAKPFSGHTAPAIHAQIGCAAPALLNVEYFFDQARIERLFFDGAPRLIEGCLRPDPSSPGLGVAFKRPDAEKYRVA